MELASGNLSYEWQFNVNNSGWIPLDNINSTILFEPDIYNWLLEEYLAGLENIVKIKVKVINMFSEYDIDIKTIYVVKEIPISSKTTGFPNFRDSKGRRHYSTMSEGIVNEIYSDEENSMDRRSTSSISTSGNNRLSSKHFSGVTRLNQNLPSFTKTSNKDTLKERMEMRLNKGKNL
jgi:hypothetical protein